MGFHLHAAHLRIASLAVVVGAGFGTYAASSSLRNVEAAPAPISRATQGEVERRGLGSSTAGARLTPTPTPTPIPSPNGAGNKAVQIVVRPARTVPSDVLEHMNWVGLGGGGRTGKCYSDLSSVPASSAEKAPQVLSPTGKVYWCYCQLRETADTKVSASLAFPNGQVRKLGTTVFDSGGDAGNCAEFSHALAPDTPAGVYKFTTRLSGRAIVDWFRPRVGQFQFQGWQPNEPIWLIVYTYPERTHSTTDVQQYVTKIHTTAGPDGRLTVALVDPSARAVPAVSVIAVGKNSDCMLYTSDLSDPIVSHTSDFSCGGNNPDVYGPNGRWVSIRWAYHPLAPIYWFDHCGKNSPSFLLPGDTAWVNTGSDRLRVRKQPRAQADIIGYLNSGESVALVHDDNGGNPVCAEGVVWWFVRGPNDLAGWSMEGNSEQFWLVPQRFWQP